VGETVTFDGSQSQPGGGGNIVSYEWDFGDGAVDSGQTVTHQYDGEGPFQVNLTVTDEDGFSNIAESTVQIIAAPEIQPTEEPTEEPEIQPTEEPTEEPEIQPTEEPEPTATPEPEPTATPEPESEHSEDLGGG